MVEIIWHPIETAPKDGMLLSCRRGVPEGVPCAYFLAAYDAEAGRWRIPPKVLNFFENPTHWKPIARRTDETT